MMQACCAGAALLQRGPASLDPTSASSTSTAGFAPALENVPILLTFTSREKCPWHQASEVQLRAKRFAIIWASASEELFFVCSCKLFGLFGFGKKF